MEDKASSFSPIVPRTCPASIDKNEAGQKTKQRETLAYEPLTPLQKVAVSADKSLASWLNLTLN